LHKNKCFSKKQGREKPENLTKNKPTHTKKRGTGKSSNYCLTTGPHPTRENKNRQTKKVTK
ncbi:hypothetical protein MHJ95_02105, partial [Corynebacterium imitans]|uniref:hypothetical protein n=1 Tax=Corynebacterium imitans TaxID=156978 RepID=UPI001EF185FF